MDLLRSLVPIGTKSQIWDLVASTISNTIIGLVELEAVVEKSTSTQLHFQFYSMLNFLASDDRAKMPSCTDTTNAESDEALKYIIVYCTHAELVN